MVLGISHSVGAIPVSYQIVAPGNANEYDDPFKSIDFDKRYDRYQQVYSASLFSNLPKGGGLLKQIYLRMDLVNAAGHVLGREPGIQIEVSTTVQTPSSLSPIFSENVGSDRTIFLAPSDTSPLDSAFEGPGRIQGWSPVFGVGRDFFYDPAKGNLLLDIRGLSQKLTYVLDATQNDAMGSVFQATPGNTDLGSVGKYSLVTRFSFFPVPEPSTVALICVGIVFLISVRTLSFKPTKEPNVTL